MLPLPSSFGIGGPRYVCNPPKGLKEKVVESDEEWQKCGKWMLYNPDGSMEWMDKVWTDLQVLLRDGPLIMLKASTAANVNEAGVVMCYTRPGKEEARKAAEAIRSIIHYDYMIYYKLSKETDSGIARRFGDSNVSIYMHSFKNRFYVRDSNSRWILDGYNAEQLNKRQLDIWKHCDLGFEQLPSKSKKWELNHQSKKWRPKSAASWHTVCQLKKDGIGLTEADRVWVVVKKLFDEGLFTRITCMKNAVKQKPETVNIYCYVEDYSDINSLINLADAIRVTAVIRAFMYFRILDGSKFKIKYVYTPEKELYEEHFLDNELYEQNNSFRKFLLQKL